MYAEKTSFCYTASLPPRWIDKVHWATRFVLLLRLLALVKNIEKYSVSNQNRRIFCNVNAITTENILKINRPIASYLQFSLPVVMRQNSFEKVLMQNTNTVFSSVKHVCCTLSKHLWAAAKQCPSLVVPDVGIKWYCWICYFWLKLVLIH